MPVVKQLRQDRRRKDADTFLENHARRFESQHGEDGIIERIFELVGARNKWCVEFGAYDGMKNSNTYNLIVNHGWSSIQIEGDTRRFEKLVATHGSRQSVHCLNAMIGFERGVNTIDACLASTPIPRDFDFISIDIDGNDYHVWDSMVEYQPRLVVIEFNVNVPNDVVYIQDRDFSINQSSSLRALVELGRHKGYELVCAVGGNAFFIMKGDFPKLGIDDNHIDSIYFPARDAKIFLLFDGTLVNVGLRELRLRQRDPKPYTVDPFEFQVYSEDDRFYGGRVAPDRRPAEASMTNRQRLDAGDSHS